MIVLVHLLDLIVHEGGEAGLVDFQTTRWHILQVFDESFAGMVKFATAVAQQSPVAMRSSCGQPGPVWKRNMWKHVSHVQVSH